MEDAGGRQGGTDAKKRISEKESVTGAATIAASVKNGGFIPELKAPDREPTCLKKIDLCVRILAGKYQTCQTVLEFIFWCLPLHLFRPVLIPPTSLGCCSSQVIQINLLLDSL